MKKNQKQKEYRKFEAEVMGMPPLTMALADIPEPDPGKKQIGQEKAMPQKMLFRKSDIVNRIIAHLKAKE